MPYYTKVLQPDETVKAVGRLHWLIYGRAFAVLILAGAVLVGSYWLPDPDWQRYAQMASGAIGVFGLLLLLKAFIRRMGTEIVVTDRRVILNKGFLRRHTTEMNMSKVNTVHVEQSLAGRIWGYGTVWIRGTGADIEPLEGVGSPLIIRNAIVAE